MSTTLKPTDLELRDFLEQRLEKGFATHLIPPHMHDAVREYILNRHQPGDFLTAIMSNDFLEAASRADEKNQRALWGWACFLHNYVPAACCGSTAKVNDWLNPPTEEDEVEENVGPTDDRPTG